MKTTRFAIPQRPLPPAVEPRRQRGLLALPRWQSRTGRHQPHSLLAQVLQSARSSTPHRPSRARPSAAYHRPGGVALALGARALHDRRLPGALRRGFRMPDDEAGSRPRAERSTTGPATGKAPKKRLARGSLRKPTEPASSQASHWPNPRVLAGFARRHSARTLQSTLR